MLARSRSIMANFNRRTVLLGGAVLFLLGAALGAVSRSAFISFATPAVSAAAATVSGPLSAATGDHSARQRDAPASYSAEVIRVIDGDTFEARVRVWPGLIVDTKVRLRGIDAPELHARCSDELAKAQAARDALASILAEGGVTISQVGIDKYGGRVDAVAATQDTSDVSAAMLSGGFARSYDGRKRGTWCG